MPREFKGTGFTQEIREEIKAAQKPQHSTNTNIAIRNHILRKHGIMKETPLR